MIHLTRTNNEPLELNHRNIQHIEPKKETFIVMMNEKKFIVKETAEEIKEKIKEYERSILIEVPLKNESKEKG